jgi:hypothetical protein
MSVYLQVALLAGAFAAVSGCSQSVMESRVAGKVTLDGKGVGPGVMVFVPESGHGGNPSTGAIQPDGSYFLKTNRDTGLAPGKYNVSVSVFDQPADVKPGERSMKEAKLVTPEKYVSAETSGLEYDVAPGNNTINIELKSK